MVTRITGLASGMDIDSIVSDMMKVKRMPLDSLKQKKQVLEWQRDDYRTINTQLLSFRDQLTSMKYTTNYRVRNVSSTNDSVVTATASSAAAQSSFSLSKVTQLATSERIKNAGSVGLDSSKSLYEQTMGNTTLWSQGGVQSKTITSDGTATVLLGEVIGNVKDTSKWSVKVDGTSYKVVDSTTFNSAAAGDKVVLIDSTGELTFKSNLTKGSSVKVDYITDMKKDTLSLSFSENATQTVSLSSTMVNSFKALSGTDNSKNQIKYTKAVKDGDTTTNTEVYFSVNSGGQIMDADNTTVLGTLDKTTGKLTFDNVAMKNKGYLPTEKPTDGKTYTYNIEVGYDQNYTNFTVDTKTSKGDKHENFIITGDNTITSVVNKVNVSTVGVNMFYDSVTGLMTMTRTETGKFNTTGNDMTIKGELLENNFKFGSGSTTTSGQNAIFTMNGIETNRSSNTFEMNGVTFTLKQTFNTDNSSTNPISLNISNNSEAVFDNIVKFINKYNELVDSIQKKYNEERYKDYAPLTDEQKEQLADTQQEQWTEKAKSGLLRRDPTLSSVLSNMRLDFYQPVSNDNVAKQYNQLASIGIKTTANYLNGGKLEIDEATLKKAIEEDPQSVENLFIGNGSTDSQKGIIYRLYDTVDNTMDQIRDKAGESYYTTKQYTMGQTLDDYEDRIERFEDRLTDLEDRYYRQFSAMESAMQKANEQSSYLSQFLSY